MTHKTTGSASGRRFTLLPTVVAAVVGVGLSVAWAQSVDLAPTPPPELSSPQPSDQKFQQFDPRTSRAFEIRKECEVAGIPVVAVVRKGQDTYQVLCKKGSSPQAQTQAEAVKARVLARPPLELKPRTALEALAVLRHHPGHPEATRLLEAEYDRVWNRAKLKDSK